MLRGAEPQYVQLDVKAQKRNVQCAVAKVSEAVCLDVLKLHTDGVNVEVYVELQSANQEVRLTKVWLYYVM